MPSVDSMLAFAVLSLALIVVPGPSVMFVVSRAVSAGRRAAFVTVLGNSLGEYVQVMLVAVGLATVVERSVLAFTVVKLVGAAYLVWLGIQAIRHRGESARLLDRSAPLRTDRSQFVDGFVVGVANPKSIVFFAAILPQFVDGAGPAVAQMMVLGVVFVAVALVSDSLWALAAGTARNWFARSPRRLARLGGTGGVVMIGLGAQLALSGRADAT
ncbi:MAG: LysE family translocator [Actinomycetota bacterium]